MITTSTGAPKDYAELICICGAPYTPHRKDQRGCSKKCGQRSYREATVERRRAEDRVRKRRAARLVAGLPETATATELHHAKRTNISYHGAHRRVRDSRGAASNYPCVDCGSQADQWSYDHKDENELVGPNCLGSVMSYSANINHYDPRCRPCHGAFDSHKEAAA